MRREMSLPVNMVMDDNADAGELNTDNLFYALYATKIFLTNKEI